MSNKLENIRKKFVGKWIVPVTKNLPTKEEVKNFLVKNYNKVDRKKYKIIKYKNSYILVRKFTQKDLNSMDFIQYIKSFNRKYIKNLIDRKK